MVLNIWFLENWPLAACGLRRLGWVTVVYRVRDDGGAPVDPLSQTGSTPLWIAAQNGHAAAVALLCARGASARGFKRVGQRVCDRVSCLDIANSGGHEHVAKILMRFGAT